LTNCNSNMNNCSCTAGGSLSRHQLMKLINESSFAQYDMLLYLDTHPMDMEAFAFYQKQTRIREDAMKRYAQQYGPLTMDLVDDTCSDSWKWAMQPWPWEVNKKGRC
jgi:spore coat protein JB